MDKAGAVVRLKPITEDVPVVTEIGLKPAADWNKDGAEIGAIVCTTELLTGFDGRNTNPPSLVDTATVTDGKVAALVDAVLTVGGGYIGLNILPAAELSEADDDIVVVTDAVKDVTIVDDVTAALLTDG